jgi:hypothetical protein
VKVSPAITDSCFQLKWNWMAGFWPTGAQVRTQVGRSDSSDSSTKTISRQRRRPPVAQAEMTVGCHLRPWPAVAAGGTSCPGHFDKAS